VAPVQHYSAIGGLLGIKAVKERFILVNVVEIFMESRVGNITGGF
jgi:hypothetical protein